MIIFDIETGPLPLDELFSTVEPFEAPETPGEFDESTVKLGNLKDPEKIKAKVRGKREEHEKLVANHEAEVARLRDEWRTSIIDRAPLDPVTGQVLAIGYQSSKGTAIQAADEDPEPSLLKQFWERYKACRKDGRLLVGHNIFGFDLPFLIRRSWILEVDIPETVIESNRWDRRVFVDTMEKWTLGRYGEFAKLDRVSRALGGERKPEDVSGKMFATLFNGNPEQRAQAIDYLKNDLSMTSTVASRLGIN